MTAAAAAQNDTIWLRADYGVTPLNPKLAGRVPEVKRALQSGVPAYPDTSRDNFFDVELPSGWAYIHIRDDRQMVYVVAYSAL
jgi:hypothetical protein